MVDGWDDDGNVKAWGKLCAMGRASDHGALVGEITAWAGVIHGSRGFGTCVVSV